MKRLFLLLCSVLALVLSPGAAHAITTVPRDFDQLVTRADTVFKGTVTSQTSQWVGEGANRHIVTFVSFQVEETYKGQAASEQTLRFMGGTVGTTTMRVPDMPQFETGEKAVLFVVGNGRQFCPLVGVAQGHFRVVKEALSGTERILTDESYPVISTAEIGQVDETGTPRLKRYAAISTPALDAESFRTAILAKVAALPR